MSGSTCGWSTRSVCRTRSRATPRAWRTAGSATTRTSFPTGRWLKEHPYLPPYLDEDWVVQAEEALKCPDTDAVMTSISGPLTVRRFLSNLAHAYQFTSYRIDRVPRYELIR